MISRPYETPFVFLRQAPSSFRCFAARLTALLASALTLLTSAVARADAPEGPFPPALETYLRATLPHSDIPGLAVVVVRDGQVGTRVFGEARDHVAVTDVTPFELGSCSKSFTALAALQLVADGRLGLNDPVSKYLPGFHVRFEGRDYDVTVEQLLHHTTGLPWRTIGRIAPSEDEGALRRTAMAFNGVEVEQRPGNKFLYASANYDIAGAVIEVASGVEFGAYLEGHVFGPLGLTETHVLGAARPSGMAEGHKLGLFAQRAYAAPLYRGNAPAGYVISDARDMGRWLALQLGAVETPLAALIARSHEANRDVPPDPADGGSYAAGWSIYQKPLGEISHSGANPNFTSYVGFSPGGHFGVAVLANSDSPQTARLGEDLMALLRGGEPSPPPPNSSFDRACSVAAGGIAALIVAALVVLGRMVADIRSGRRRFRRPGRRELALGLLGGLSPVPLLFGAAMLPQLLAGIPLETAVVWLPGSLPVAGAGLVALVVLGEAVCVTSALFPTHASLRGYLPQLVVLGLVAGVSNAGLLFLIAAAPAYHGPLAPIFCCFVAVVLVYLACQKYIDVRGVTLTYRLVHDVRARIASRILSARFQEFERLDVGRIAATLNNDAQSLGQVVPILLPLVISVAATVAIGVYLATISVAAFVAAAAVVTMLAALYTRVTRGSARFFKEDSVAQARFLTAVDGLVRGLKELSLHAEKRRGFGADMGSALARHAATRTRVVAAHFDAFIVGEGLLVVVLGTIAFVFPRLFAGFYTAQVTAFVMGLLYLIGPLNLILRAVPAMAEAQATWGRIRAFEAELTPERPAPAAAARPSAVASVALERVRFEYPSSEDGRGFGIGPLSLELRNGEIVFLVGGNGSGKTTLAKLLTGLYRPTGGRVLVDGRSVGPDELGELVSVVFADFYLFPRLYDVVVAGKEAVVEQHLDMFGLKGKVTLSDAGFSTLALSTGQRKRLALLKCLLEDRPILIFDEWAADQDPEFRRVFYRELLPALRRAGKLVIAITHDEQYFDAPNRVVRMESGRLSEVNSVPVAVS